jgi:hypothetical protein
MTTTTVTEWATHPILELNDYLKPGRTAFSDEYHNSPNAEEHNCCIVCGRKTRDNKGITVLLGLGGTGLIHPDDEAAAESRDMGYMGVWMVGPDCGADIPAEYRCEALGVTA